MPPVQQYQTLGRGRLYFAKSVDGTTMSDDERYLGNCPAFEISTAVERLDHFSSESGIRVKDKSTETQRTRTASFTTDNISFDNLAFMFGTDAVSRTTAAITDDGDTLTVLQGHYYQLGKRTNRPEGVRTITDVVVRDNTGVKATGTMTFSGQPAANDTLTINAHVITFKTSGATGAQVDIGGTATLTAQNVKAYIEDNLDTLQVVPSGASTVITLTATSAGTWGNSITLARSGSFPAVSDAELAGGTNGGAIPSSNNWSADLASGRLYIEEGSQIADDAIIVVVYNVTAQTQTVLQSEDAVVKGSLRFIADNPEGINRNVYLPWVDITPTGSLPLISDTWLALTFTADILTPLDGVTQQVYWD